MKYPDIDPIIFSVGPLHVRWYGMMYVVGFFMAYWIVRHLSSRDHYDMSKDEIEDCLTYTILGVIVGGRLGYCLFYNLAYYLQHPIEVLYVWTGGMSFHGGLLGFATAGWIFAKRYNKSFWMLSDLGAIGSTAGLFSVRLGNFINGELFGRVTDVPWAMVFPGGGPLPRHPSQLYESFMEGPLLFTVLYLIARKDRTHGVIFGCFLIFYGAFRFFLEFFREPDAHLGFIVAHLSMGQLLCSAMIIAGSVILGLRLRVMSK